MSKKQQLILRPFITYSPTENPLAYSIGYSYLRSYPYTENAIPATKPEHNIWEQITLSQVYKELSFSHRFRLEHRFQGNLVMNSNQNYAVDDFSFSNRFRYRLTVRYPIFNNWFINIFDELWINMNENFQYPAYDRNWLYLGIGYEIMKNGNIQVAYLHQNIKKMMIYLKYTPHYNSLFNMISILEGKKKINKSISLYFVLLHLR